MAEKSLAEKMHLKHGKTGALLNVPASLGDLTAGFPAGVAVVQGDAPVDVILIFIENHAEAERELPAVKSRLLPGGALWAAFRKGNTTDINRDSLFTIAAGFGLQPCANISIDDEWSALRLKVAG